MNRLNSLSAVETKTLLSKYFDKVIILKTKERKTNLHCSEMEVSSMVNLGSFITREMCNMR